MSKTDNAILKAKERDLYMCRVCRAQFARGDGQLHGAHLLPRRVGFKKYDKADYRNIVSMCPACHRMFDSLVSPVKKASWLWVKGLRYFARRIMWIIGEIGQPQGDGSPELPMIYGRVK